MRRLNTRELLGYLLPEACPTSARIYIRRVFAPTYYMKLICLSLAIPSANMKVQTLAAGVLFASSTLAGVVKRDGLFTQGQPVDGKGKGAPILSMVLSLSYSKHTDEV